MAALAIALALGACSSQQSAQHATSVSGPLHNPIDFPLYPGSALLSTHSFTQVINADTSSGGSSIFSSGNGTYNGQEVIASSNAAFSDLSTWVDRVNTTPPAGYKAVESGANPNEHVQAQRYGIDYAVFSKKDSDNKTHGLLVIVMDPQVVNLRLGVVLHMIARYRALPDVMRAPIDNEAKARIGMTITEATQPDSPVGAALAALDEFEHKDSRGIVMLDAAKK